MNSITNTFKIFGIMLCLSSIIIVLLSVIEAAAEPHESRRILSLSASAQIKVKPDSVFINTGITTHAPSARQALDRNNQTMAHIIESLKESGLSPDDIQTINFSVGPNYSRHRQHQKRVITGFQVNNSVRIEVKNIPSLGTILDKVVSLGANRINSISFRINQTQDLKEKVRQKAIAKIKKKARFYAQNMGVSLGEIISISERGAISTPRPHMMAMAASDSMRSSVPIASGKGTLTATVFVSWTIK